MKNIKTPVLPETNKSLISEGIGDAVATGLRKLGRKVDASNVVSKSKAAFSNQSSSEISAKAKFVDKFLSNIDSALSSYIQSTGGLKELLKQQQMVAEMSFTQFNALLEWGIAGKKIVREADKAIDTGPIATYITRLMINNVLKGINATQYIPQIKVIAQKLEQTLFNIALKQIQANPDVNPKPNLNKVNPFLTQLANLAWAAASVMDSGSTSSSKSPDADGVDKSKVNADATQAERDYDEANDSDDLKLLISRLVKQFKKIGGNSEQLLQLLQSELSKSDSKV